jgi:hypothetical protein
MNNDSSVVKAEKKSLQISEAESHLALPLCEGTAEAITTAVRYIIVSVGIPEKNYPGKVEVLVMNRFIRNNYPDFSLEEIKYAFDLAVARRLGEDVDPVCYGALSAEYIGRILSAYIRYRGLGIFFSTGSQWRERIQNAFDSFLRSGEHIYYPLEFYYQLRDDNIINQCQAPQRAFQIHVKICALFEYAREVKSALYERCPIETEPQNDHHYNNINNL